ncbi:MAG: hypothetical protein RI572_09005 [Salegentibacter sp.]|uniref:Uncharacterized protein n=1 Tax=Salegentibacter flavus TaxID=287099 RepID=A0A1I5A057_9FLAO|nr:MULTISPECIES: hypothetical protein [Salegentibacter]MDR9457535.1 hypothetical protein [Salegentibacter sp.]SFN55871.1 hypothetical protein SAMN05660413_01609 [Salegentibacter flavus]
MKAPFFIFSIVLLSILSSCGSNKELQERAPAQFNEVYYSETEDGLDLYIPVSVIQESRVQLESVYFRGMHSPLQLDEEQSNLYIASFALGKGDKVMHVDPKEEYGNKAPQAPKESPFEINKDEAILVFKQNDKTKYYKLTGIEERN